MARWRLSSKVGAGCVRTVGSSADRSDGHRAMELHRSLMGGGRLVGR